LHATPNIVSQHRQKNSSEIKKKHFTIRDPYAHQGLSSQTTFRAINLVRRYLEVKNVLNFQLVHVFTLN